MPFDIEGAKKEGYTDREIAEHIAKSKNFDIQGAKKEGYSDSEIIQHLSEARSMEAPEATASPSIMRTPKIFGGQPIRPSDSVEGKSEIMNMLGNVPQDAIETLSTLYQAIRHPYNPFKTLSLGLLGGIGKLLPGEGKEGSLRQLGEGVAGEMGKGLKEDYGGVENIKRRVVKHPIGSLMDIAGILGAGGLASKGLGFGELGSALIKTSNVVDPLVQAGSVLKKSINLTGRIGSHAWGAVTNVGDLAIKNAAKGSPELVAMMRGSKAPEVFIQDVRSALESVKINRGNAYREDWSKFSKNSNKVVDVTPIKAKFNRMVNEFNLKVDSNGEVINKFKSLDSKTNTERLKLANQIKGWFDDPKPKTLLMLDDLKRNLDDFYIESSKNRAIPQAMRDSVKQLIIKHDPVYAKMVAEYQDVSATIKELENTFSLQGNARKKSADTVMKKLISTMKESPDMRRNLLQKLEESSGMTNIDEQISGYLLSSELPTGIIGRGIEAGGLVTLLYGWDPAIVGLMMSSSPRLTGEFLTLMAGARKAVEPAVKPVLKAAPTITKAGYQAGRAANYSQGD